VSTKVECDLSYHVSLSLALAAQASNQVSQHDCQVLASGQVLSKFKWCVSVVVADCNEERSFPTVQVAKQPHQLHPCMTAVTLHVLGIARHGPLTSSRSSLTTTCQHELPSLSRVHSGQPSPLYISSACGVLSRSSHCNRSKQSRPFKKQAAGAGQITHV